MDVSEKEKYRNIYDAKKPSYLKLAENLSVALKELVEREHVDVVQIGHRVKDFDSFCDKLDRKKYSEPFDQMEDICGLRIIVYYTSDLDKVGDLIKREFEVLEFIDKTDLLEGDRFGYRSDHYIVKIPSSWEGPPHYRGLRGLKAEVQIRTISMHAWAGVQHKLAYKSEEDAPIQFRRKLNQLSALFELADDNFERLRMERESFKTELYEKQEFDLSQPMNLDTLQVYLDIRFPSWRKNLNETADLLTELSQINIGFLQIENAYKKVRSFIHKLKANDGVNYVQVGIVRAILDIADDSYWNWRLSLIPGIKDTPWYADKLKWRQMIEEHTRPNTPALLPPASG